MNKDLITVNGLWYKIKKFFKNIECTDILLIMNEDRNDQFGYIGYEVFAELTFGIMQKLIYNKVIILH